MKKELAQIEPNIVNFTVLSLDMLELNEGQLEGLPSNPREIEDKKFDLLKENIKKYPQFLQYNMLKVYKYYNNLLAELKNRLKISIFLWRKKLCISLIFSNFVVSNYKVIYFTLCTTCMQIS